MSQCPHVPGGGGVLDDGLDLSTVVAEPNVVAAIFLHGDGPLEWTVTHGQLNVVGGGFLDALGGLVCTVACYNLPIDLWVRECKIKQH